MNSCQFVLNQIRQHHSRSPENIWTLLNRQLEKDLNTGSGAITGGNTAGTRTGLMWTGQILMGVLFILVGFSKITGGIVIAEQFESWGYPADFRFVVGAVEFLCGIGLLIPRTARYAAYGLIGVMTGAFLTHVLNAEYPRLMINTGIAGALFLIAHARHQEKIENAEV